MSIVSVIEISEVGPVHLYRLEIPESGGIVVIKGKNGLGKSKILDATRVLLGAEQKLSLNDDADDGYVAGFGSKIKVYKSKKQRTGNSTEDMGVEHIEDEFSIADFVDPQVADEDARATKQIKSLCRLSGAKIEFAAFEQLIPQSADYPSVALEDARKVDDAVDRAAKVKKIIEAEARRIESLAEEERRRQANCEQAAGEVDTSVVPDRMEQQQRHAAAIVVHSKLVEQVDAYERSTQARLAARDQLDRARLSYAGPTVIKATAAHLVAKAKFAECERIVAELHKKLLVAEAELTLATSEAKSAEAALQAAESHMSTVETLAKALDAESPTCPTEAEVSAAKSRVDQAAADIELGIKIRDAAAQKDKASQHAKIASKHAARAESLRDAAKSADGLLSKAVRSTDLKVRAGRLIYTGGPTEELFDRLSKGERARVAAQIVAERVGERGDGTKLSVLPQELWEGLDPDARDLVNDVCVTCGVTFVTGECSRGELRSVVYGQPDEASAIGELEAKEVR